MTLGSRFRKLFNKKNVLWDIYGMKHIPQWTGLSQASYRVSTLLGIQPWNASECPLIYSYKFPKHFHPQERIMVLTQLFHFTGEGIIPLKREELPPGSPRDLEVHSLWTTISWLLNLNQGSVHHSNWNWVFESNRWAQILAPILGKLFHLFELLFHHLQNWD